MGTTFARLSGQGHQEDTPPPGPSRVSDQDKAILVFIFRSS